MMPRSSMQAPTFSSRAIAYLKAAVARDPAEPSIAFSGVNAPVLRDLQNGLVVSYVVDTGNQFEYVQHRHLAEDKISEDDLHAIGLDNLSRVASAKGIQVSTHPSGQ